MKYLSLNIAASILAPWIISGSDWLAVFLVCSALLWLSTFGYVLLIGLLKHLRENKKTASADDQVRVAVVVPVLNETALIGAKLANLMQTQYPFDLMRIMVVDGGSSDGTQDKVLEFRQIYPEIEIHHVPQAKARSDQINHILAKIDEPIAVFTDVDSELDPNCIARLINELQADSRIALVGAQVEPVTPLLEEKIHWWLVNQIWRSEGEALYASMVSGVCYACRSNLLFRLAPSIASDDIHLALRAALTDNAARICPDAKAFELRTPGNLRQMIQFRQRRGLGYLRELNRSFGKILSRLPHSINALMHLWHLTVLPYLFMVSLISGLICIWSGQWQLPVLILAASVLQHFILLVCLQQANRYDCSWIRLFWAGTVHIGILLISIITMFSPKGLAKEL